MRDSMELKFLIINTLGTFRQIMFSSSHKFRLPGGLEQKE